MKRNTNRNEGSGPEDRERMEEYWDDNRQEADLPWDARKTDRHKSKSKGRAKDSRRRSMPDPQKDEFIDDSDLD